MKNKNSKRKTNKIFLSILCCIIFALIVVMLYVNKTYINRDEYRFDYLKVSAKNYEEYNKNRDIRNKKGVCFITWKTQFTDDKDLSELGNKVKVNGKYWVKQEFENGQTWMSYYENSLYIIQMYGQSKGIYDSICKKEFDSISKTFSFSKSE